MYIPALWYARNTPWKIDDQKTWYFQGGVKLMQFNFLGNWSVFQLAVNGAVEICKIICFSEIDEFLTEKSPHIINWLLGPCIPILTPVRLHCFAWKHHCFCFHYYMRLCLHQLSTWLQVEFSLYMLQVKIIFTRLILNFLDILALIHE